MKNVKESRINPKRMQRDVHKQLRNKYTVGIKIPWTLHDEENWNHTHRLAGWVWMLCGLLIILNAFFPLGESWMLPVIFAVIILVPLGYSFIYYLRHKK